MRLGKWLAGSLLVLSFSTAYGQRNMSEARPEIRELLVEATAKYWTNAQVDSAWNRAQRIVGLWAGILIAKLDSVNSIAGQDKYALASDYFRIRSLWRGKYQNRSPIMIVDDPYSLEIAGANVPGEYGWVHGTNLYLFPVPTGIDRYYIFYYAPPTLLTSDRKSVV